MGRDEENGNRHDTTRVTQRNSVLQRQKKGLVPGFGIPVRYGVRSHLIHVVLTAKEMILMNSNAVRAAIHERIDPVIEAIITEELRDKGGQQPLSAPVPPSSSSLEDVLVPALAAVLAPALAPSLTAAITPALTAALTAALTPALSAILSPASQPSPHENGHESKPESSSPPGSEPGEGGGSHEG